MHDRSRSLPRDPTDPIAKFLADSEHFFFRPVFRAMIEIMIAAARNRELARIVNPIVLDARHTLNGIWIETLGVAGYPRERAQQFIELTHYLLRGVFLVSTWLPYEIDRSEIIEAWRRVAPTILERRGNPRRPRRRRKKSRMKRRFQIPAELLTKTWSAPCKCRCSRLPLCR